MKKTPSKMLAAIFLSNSIHFQPENYIQETSFLGCRKEENEISTDFFVSKIRYRETLSIK